MHSRDGHQLGERACEGQGGYGLLMQLRELYAVQCRERRLMQLLPAARPHPRRVSHSPLSGAPRLPCVYSIVTCAIPPQKTLLAHPGESCGDFLHPPPRRMDPPRVSNVGLSVRSAVARLSPIRSGIAHHHTPSAPGLSHRLHPLPPVGSIRRVSRSEAPAAADARVVRRMPLAYTMHASSAHASAGSIRRDGEARLDAPGDANEQQHERFVDGARAVGRGLQQVVLARGDVQLRQAREYLRVGQQRERVLRRHGRPPTALSIRPVPPLVLLHPPRLCEHAVNESPHIKCREG
jgi:hypothetical protein